MTEFDFLNLHKNAFIHIPKTAGRYIDRSLCRPNSIIDPLGNEILQVLNYGHSFYHDSKMLGETRHGDNYEGDDFGSWSPNAMSGIRRTTNNIELRSQKGWPKNTFKYYTVKGYENQLLLHKLSLETVITSIRNPFYLLKSMFTMSCGEGFFCCNILQNTFSFEKFVDVYCDEDTNWFWPDFKDNLFGQLYRGKDLIINKDNIIRFENLDNDIDRIAEKYSLKRNYPNHKIPKVKLDIYKDRENFTPYVVKKLRKKFEPLLNEFNYDY